MFGSFPFLIALAIAPSIIWLLFYLRKDAHPESNRMILEIFIFGMAAALLAVFIELGFFQLTGNLPLSPFWLSMLNIFIGVALVEEFLKYLVVRQAVLSSSEFDEPLDVQLYLIIAALGFVALENLLIFLSPLVFDLKLAETLALAGFRFISATFLHALASGILGYFLALSFFYTAKKWYFMSAGFVLAALWHGFYNFTIIRISENMSYSIVVIIILASAAVIVSLGFKSLKKLQSICKL